MNLTEGYDFYTTMRWCYFCREHTLQREVVYMPWNWREVRKMGTWECKNDHSGIPSYRALYTKDEDIIYMRDPNRSEKE